MRPQATAQKAKAIALSAAAVLHVTKTATDATHAAAERKCMTAADADLEL